MMAVYHSHKPYSTGNNFKHDPMPWRVISGSFSFQDEMGWQTIVVTACIEIDLLEILPHRVFICCVQQCSGFGIKEIEKLVRSVLQINKQTGFILGYLLRDKCCE